MDWFKWTDLSGLTEKILCEHISQTIVQFNLALESSMSVSSLNKKQLTAHLQNVPKVLTCVTCYVFVKHKCQHAWFTIRQNNKCKFRYEFHLPNCMWSLESPKVDLPNSTLKKHGPVLTLALFVIFIEWKMLLINSSCVWSVQSA